MHMTALYINMISAIWTKSLYESMFIIKHFSMLIKIAYGKISLFNAAAIWF